jgi:hypothetical protein
MLLSLFFDGSGKNRSMPRRNLHHPAEVQAVARESLSARALPVKLGAPARRRRQGFFNGMPGIRYTGCRIDVADGRIIAVHLPETGARRRLFTALCSRAEALGMTGPPGRRSLWRDSSLRNDHENGCDRRGR